MTEGDLPNILITGTPGVGKSTICEKLCNATGFTWQNVSKIAKDNDFITEYDNEYQTSILDEDKLLDHMEPLMADGGNVVEYHGCDFFPERWFHAVFVLRTDNTQLYDRLVARGYTGKKLDDNIQCEIFQTILDEAKSSYDPSIVIELQNDNEEEIERNIKEIANWIKKWMKSSAKRRKKA